MKRSSKDHSQSCSNASMIDEKCVCWNECNINVIGWSYFKFKTVSWSTVARLAYYIVCALCMPLMRCTARHDTYYYYWIFLLSMPHAIVSVFVLLLVFALYLSQSQCYLIGLSLIWISFVLAAKKKEVFFGDKICANLFSVFGRCKCMQSTGNW